MVILAPAAPLGLFQQPGQPSRVSVPLWDSLYNCRESEPMLSHSSITNLALEEWMSNQSKTSRLLPGTGLAYASYTENRQPDFDLGVRECLGLPR